MKITYVTEDTELWGGIAVIFQHLELLAGAGHDAFLTTPASGPDWYDLKVPVIKIKGLEPQFIPQADIIVATSWRTIEPVMESKKGIPVHLCQGLENSYKEFFSLKEQIDYAYSLNLPRLIVSQHLDSFFKERFNAKTFYVGQALNKEIFHPFGNPVRRFPKSSFKPSSILVAGPFQGSFKNIPLSLKGIKLANKKLKSPLKLIRVSQFPLSHEEEAIITPDIYHFRIPYQDMGNIYRNSDIFISMSTNEEGFGLPALEAMACGVPAILSSIPSYLGFDDSPDFAIFAESRPEAVSEAILHLYKNAKARHKLIKKGFSVSGKFTKEALLARLTKTFKEIISDPEAFKI